MTINEFIEAVESYGVSIPMQVRNSRIGPVYLDVIGAHRVGSGNPRAYSAFMVRRLVAFLLVQATTWGRLAFGGNQYKRSANWALHRQAMRLMAAAPEGWVIMAEGRAWWSLVAPVHTLRSQCAVAIPVPEWRH